MPMVDVVSCLPTGGLMAQVGRLGPWVGSHLALLYIHRVNSRNDSIKIVLGIIIIIFWPFIIIIIIFFNPRYI